MSFLGFLLLYFQCHRGLINASDMLTISYSSCLSGRIRDLTGEPNILWDFWVAQITSNYILAGSKKVNIALKENMSKCMIAGHCKHALFCCYFPSGLGKSTMATKHVSAFICSAKVACLKTIIRLTST